jgi:ribosomal protein L44E
MSTRALYTFQNENESWNVYKHHDGYPQGAAETIANAVKWFAWQLPRFEPDEFAAAFCAAGKAHNMIQVIEGKQSLDDFEKDEKRQWSHGGGVRFMPQGDPREVLHNECSDCEYRYEVKPHKKKGTLQVNAYAVSAFGSNYSEKKLFSGTLADFLKFAVPPKKEEEEDTFADTSWRAQK